MRRGEPIGDLARILRDLSRGKRSMAHRLAQGFALQQFGYEIGHAVLRADIVDREHVGMVEGGDGPGLLLKATHAVFITDKGERQNLHGDGALEARVACAKDFTHAARAEGREDFIRAEFVACG